MIAGHPCLGRCAAMTEVGDQVRTVVAQVLDKPAEQVSLGASFEELRADSLDRIEMIMEFEKAFNMQIPDQVAEEIRTVQDAIDYIETHRPT
jgi:acyl carrier protein